MYCPKCGRKNSKNQTYCENCGELLIGKKEPGDTSFDKMKGPIGVLAVLLIAGGVLLLGRSSNETLEGGTPGSGPDGSGGPDNGLENEYEINWSAAGALVPVEANIAGNAVTFQGHSYYIFDNGCESWNEAKKFCESRGGYLAVINSSEENEFLYNYMLSTGFDEVFMGYTDQYHEGHWEWVSGKTSDFTDWGINDEGSIEPNADSDYEDYAHMNSAMHSGHWNDKRFGKTTSCYFCEWDLISYLDEECEGTVIDDGVPMTNNAAGNADIIVRLKRDEAVRVLYLLTDDNGDQWYYVRHNKGTDGYIEAEMLDVN